LHAFTPNNLGIVPAPSRLLSPQPRTTSKEVGNGRPRVRFFFSECLTHLQHALIHRDHTERAKSRFQNQHTTGFYGGGAPNQGTPFGCS